ncbi:MAG: PCRF domain-containing protein, partial [Bacteroidales bacterium]|nr:PCRF domain-containing protein [Bacteroidales bacterium]
MFDIDAKLIELENELEKTQAPDFWSNSNAAEEQMRKINSIKKWTNAYADVKEAVDDLKVLFEFLESGDAEESEVEEQYSSSLSLIEDLESKNMLRKVEDRLGAILKINAGAGGTESQDWSEMLMRMYIRWGEQNKFKVKQI